MNREDGTTLVLGALLFDYRWREQHRGLLTPHLFNRGATRWLVGKRLAGVGWRELLNRCGPDYRRELLDACHLYYDWGPAFATDMLCVLLEYRHEQRLAHAADTRKNVAEGRRLLAPLERKAAAIERAVRAEARQVRAMRSSCRRSCR